MLDYASFVKNFKERLSVHLEVLTNQVELTNEDLFCPNISCNAKTREFKVNEKLYDSRRIVIPVNIGDLCIQSYFGWTRFTNTSFSFERKLNDRYECGLMFVLLPKAKYVHFVKPGHSLIHTAFLLSGFKFKDQRQIIFDEVCQTFVLLNKKVFSAYYNAYKIVCNRGAEVKWDSPIVLDELFNYGFNISARSQTSLEEAMLRLKSDASAI